MIEPLVGFFPFFADLAETTRLVPIVRQYQALGGRAVLFSHGGQYESLAAAENLQVHRVPPIYSAEQTEELVRFDRLEKFGDPFPVERLFEHVRNESEAFARQGVAVVVTGFNLPCALSARKGGGSVGLDLVGYVLRAVLPPGMATLPDNFENRFTRLLPSWLTNSVALPARTATGAFNAVAAKLGLPQFPTTLMGSSGQHDLFLRCMRSAALGTTSWPPTPTSLPQCRVA
jgi:hypothetical protein